MAFFDIGVYEIKVLDHTYEDAEHGIWTPVLTSANITAQNALNATYLAAVQALILGKVIEKTTTSLKSVEQAPVPPTDGNAQIEMNWMIIYRDTVTLEDYTYRIQTPDMVSTLRLPNSDFADLTKPLWVTFKNAFQAAARSKVGNPVILTNAILVGKNA